MLYRRDRTDIIVTRWNALDIADVAPSAAKLPRGLLLGNDGLQLMLRERLRIAGERIAPLTTVVNRPRHQQEMDSHQPLPAPALAT